MKTILVTVLFSALSFVGFSQIKNIKINNEITLDHIYAGSISGTFFGVDSLKTASFVNLRFAAMGTYKPAKWISVRAFAVYNMQTKAAPFSISQFWLKLTPIKKLSLETGDMGTLPTEQRTLPVTSNGQFETFTEANSQWQ